MDVELSLIDFLEDENDDLLNPRGDITDTTDIQDSVSEVGQTKPVTLTRQNGERYWCIGGHRTITALRRMGKKTVRADIIESSADPILLMIADNVRRDPPPSKLGTAMRRLIETRHISVTRVARASGMKVEKVKLLIDLSCAPEAIQKRVDKGELALNAWRELRHKPKAVQEKILEMEKPTVRKIRELAHANTDAPMFLGQPLAQHALLGEAKALRLRVNQTYTALSEAERVQLLSVIEAIANTLKESL